MSDATRVVYMGTSEFAVPALKKLVGTPCEVVAVVTQPDRPVGRKRILTAPPVKEEAVRHGLHVLQPEKAKDPLFIEEIRGLEPDIAIVASYGQILKKALLEAPRLGCLNIHGSLLPKYRGASPIQTAILEGESETGVTIMQMDAGLDTGDMLSKVITPIHDEDTAQTLHDRLAEMGGDLLMETLPLVLEGRLQPEKQDDCRQATRARSTVRMGGLTGRQRPYRSGTSHGPLIPGRAPFPNYRTAEPCGSGGAIRIPGTMMPLRERFFPLRVDALRWPVGRVSWSLKNCRNREVGECWPPNFYRVRDWETPRLSSPLLKENDHAIEAIFRALPFVAVTGLPGCGPGAIGRPGGDHPGWGPGGFEGPGRPGGGRGGCHLLL